jgi:hypothetical protein
LLLGRIVPELVGRKKEVGWITVFVSSLRETSERRTTKEELSQLDAVVEDEGWKQRRASK